MKKLVLAYVDNLYIVVGEVLPPIVKSAQASITTAMARGPPFLADERGSMNIGGIMLMGIAMVFLAVGFIMFPISTTACTTLLAYEYSANTSITDASFTGLTAMIGITPLLILVGFVSAAVITGFLGMKLMKGGEGSSKLSPGNMLLLGLSIVFIAIGLIIEPVMLDGVSSVVHGAGLGISSSFTGLSGIIAVCPLLVHVAFIASAVVSGFFGIKSLGK